MKIQSPDKIILARNKKKDDLIILLDMDGVVSFWEKSAAKTLNIDLDNEEVRKELKGGGRIEKFVEGGESKMWEDINKEGIEWWTSMELLPWANKLYNKLKEKSEHFSFLTSPAEDPICAAGKISFLRKHFGDDFKDFLIGTNKEFCASRRSLLIDDSKKKVDKFREFGGHAFQWPNPLTLMDNEKDVDDTIVELINYIDEISW